jgi:hypothetical protein
VFDREETTMAAPGQGGTNVSFVISPNKAATTTATILGVCGEAAVISINGANADGSFTDSALSASIARNDMTATSGFENGWIYLNTSTAANANGLPIIGQSFVRAANGSVNYGFGFNNKVTR